MHLYQRMERPMLPVDALALHLLQPGQTRPLNPRSIQRLLRALDTQGYAYGSLLPVQVCPVVKTFFRLFSKHHSCRHVSVTQFETKQQKTSLMQTRFRHSV